MKKKILSLLLVIMLISSMFVLTACGDDDDDMDEAGNEVVENLNDAISEILSDWKERGYGGTLSIYYIQNKLDSLGVDYTIIASGDEEFTSVPESDETEYVENVSGYSGNSFSNMRMMETGLDVNYCIVYDVEADKYYNVEISYDSSYVVSNSVKTEYPVFSNATEIK